MHKILYRFLTRIHPEKIRDHYEELLIYSNINIKPNLFLGIILFFSIGLSLFLSIVLATIFKFSLLLTFIILFILFELMIYFLIVLYIDKKNKLIESILPDALQLMASNLKAGLTTDRALLLSARPEFGPLQVELSSVGKEIAVGKEISEALMNMTKRVKSESLRKTILLIISGLKSGGELTFLLEQTARSLRQQRLVKEKIRSNVLMYIIFIFSAIGFGAPLLFGLSSFLVGVLTKNLATIEIPKTAGIALPITFGKISVSADFIRTFAISCLVTNSILGSLVLGLISKGKERAGIKFIPLLIIISISLFFLIRYFVELILSGLFGI